MSALRKKSDKKKLKNNAFFKRIPWFKFFKNALIPIAAIIVIALLFFGIKFMFLNSHFFSVSNIRVSGAGDPGRLMDLALVRSCLHKNIFIINIKGLSSGLKKSCPEFKEVTVKRIMPDTIKIDIVPRIAVAAIKTYKYFPIDEFGFVISSTDTMTKGVPVITGISSWQRPKVGEKYSPKKISLALSIIKNIEDSNALGQFRFESVDISNIRNIRLYISDGPEIRLGQGGYRKKIEKLSLILADAKLDIKNLEYIDLRFKDAVLGPKR